MSRFDLPDNFLDNPESLVRKKRVTNSTPSPVVAPSVNNLDNRSQAPSQPNPMAQKSLREYSVPTTTNIKVGPALAGENMNFELKTSVITMVQAHPFSGLGSDDARGHLQTFLEICETFKLKDVDRLAVRLRLFPFSLNGKAKTWFYANRDTLDTWDKLSTAFLTKYFPVGKTNALRGKISNFHQAATESVPEAWERL